MATGLEETALESSVGSYVTSILDPATGDDETLLELDNAILAFAYDPRHDLIALSIEGGRILIYSGEGQQLVNKEFKVINKVLASLYTGVPSLVFQDEKLKIEAAGGAVAFHLPADRILKRYCDLQRNKDMIGKKSAHKTEVACREVPPGVWDAASLMQRENDGGEPWQSISKKRTSNV
jgi:hypothetical protein